MDQNLRCCAEKLVEVEPRDLPLYCPRPPSWDGHPRVFLKIAETGEARCPYCGTLYVLKGGVTPNSGH
ncbi:zinc-finger domain-containing protein [Acidithiobacillus caldus]